MINSFFRAKKALFIRDIEQEGVAQNLAGQKKVNKIIAVHAKGRERKDWGSNVENKLDIKMYLWEYNPKY